MSANNYIQINRETFEVWDKDVETDNGFLVGKANTLEKAIDVANEYMRENVVEYGILFKPTK